MDNFIFIPEYNDKPTSEVPVYTVYLECVSDDWPQMPSVMALSQFKGGQWLAEDDEWKVYCWLRPVPISSEELQELNRSVATMPNSSNGPDKIPDNK